MKRIVEKLKGALGRVRARGISHVLAECAFRVANRWSDAAFNIDTSGFVDTHELGYDNRDLVHYSPLGYRAIRDALRHLPIDPQRSVFLDYGCGKGRAIAVAASMPFQRVIGVELSEPLIDKCRENLARMRGKHASQVELHCVDATRYSVPHDVNVIYFFNPFRGDTLAAVLANIQASQREHPRRIHVVYFNNDHFEKLVAGNAQVTRIHAWTAYENISCARYVLDPVQ